MTKSQFLIITSYFFNISSYINFVIKESRFPEDVYDISIDPGHGGIDGGANKNGYEETDFNMNIATTSNDTEGCVDDLPTDECKCEISIHYDSLSEENKCVADALIANGNAYLFNSFKDIVLEKIFSTLKNKINPNIVATNPMTKNITRNIPCNFLSSSNFPCALYLAV